MPLDDHWLALRVVPDAHGVIEAELLDARGYLAYLPVGVLLRVARVGYQLVGGNHFHGKVRLHFARSKGSVF